MEHSNSILRTTIQRVTNYMTTIESSTNANAWLLEENFCPDSLKLVTQRIVRLNPNVLSCTVSAEPDLFPQYGHYFSVYTLNDVDSITTAMETDYAYYDKAWYKTPLNSGKPCWIDPFVDYTEGAVNHHEAVATYCRPLCSPSGKILGVIATEFSFAQLSKNIIATENTYPGAYFILLGGDGRYLIHPDSTRLFRKTIFSDADPMVNADRIALGHEMTDAKQGTLHVRINDQRYHVNYRPVPGTDWSIAMVCPDVEVLAGFNRLGYVIILILLLGLVGMALLSRVVVHQTIRPIKQLLTYTQHIVDGNYNEIIPRTKKTDVIGQLQNGFATMQEALHNHMGSISRTSEELKKRNEQRARDMALAEETVKKKTLFIQNLSHQMRTPLNIIMGFVDVLNDRIVERDNGQEKQGKSAHEELSEMISMMKYNAIHLKRMILMLFDSSSNTGAEELMNNRTDEVSCNEVARESIELTEDHFMGVKISFDTTLNDGVHILTNHLYLMRSIRELLYNSAKYSDGKHIHLAVTETTTTVLFTVTDVGPGLPNESDELLFKPFIKLDDLSEGLGLGLPLTKRHALSLGGDLIYDPSYREGCRFVLELPK
jgi:signal transduction histidine kinase